MMEKMRNKKKKGFTLIELIVVIVILGILAAIAIPRLGGFRDNAEVASDNATAATIAKAAAIYYAEKDNLTGFDVTKYVDAGNYDSSKLTDGPDVDADGNVTVTYGKGKYPAD